MRRYFYLFLIITGASLSAGGTPSNDSGGFFAIDVGAFADNLLQELNNSSQYKTQVSTLSGFLRLRPAFTLGKRFYLEPSLGFVLPWTKDVDGTTLTFPIQFNLNLAIPLFSFLHLRVGPGIYSRLNVGSGSSVELNNGSADVTSTFFSPSGPTLSAIFTADAALEIDLSRAFSVSFDAYVLDIASASRRAFQASATLGIHL